jgi:hypothetical protein
MSSFKFSNSADVFPEELDLFQTPPTNTTCERVQYVNYRTKTQFQDGSPLEFSIPSTGSSYIDLKKTVMKVTIRASKENGEIAIEDKIFPVNLSLHSLFSRCEIYFNQKLVCGGDVMYPYKAYLETLLDYGREAKETQLSCAGYYKDTPVLMEDFESGNNTGFEKRFLSIIKGKLWQLEGPIMMDICQQERYILNQVEVSIKLYPSTNEFFFMSNNPSGCKYTIVDAYLQVCMVTPSPWVVIGHKEALDKGNALYPYNRSNLKTLSVTKGEFGFQLEDVYQGLVPKDIIIALVSSKSFNGSYDTNPFNFHHYNISSLGINIDGMPVPGQALQLDFSSKQFMDGYTTIFKALDKDSKDIGCDITPHDYQYGYSLFVFNLLPNEYLPLIKRANLRIEGRFHKPLSENINVVILGKFPSILEIDRERNIFIK